MEYIDEVPVGFAPKGYCRPLFDNYEDCKEYCQLYNKKFKTTLEPVLLLFPIGIPEYNDLESIKNLFKNEGEE